jgi:hypothetical protein
MRMGHDMLARGGMFAMPICDDLARACADLGLLLVCQSDRVQPRYRLALDGEPDAPTLQLTLRDDRDVSARLLDVDLERRGLLLELSVKTVRREPNFDLWLEDIERERWLVIREDAEWQLRPVAGVETIGELGP